jgi:hypothetical protein
MIDPKLALRVKRAWNSLNDQQRARIRPLFEKEHVKLETLLSGEPSPAPIRRRELVYFRTVLGDREDVYRRSASMAAMQAGALGGEITTNSSGEIIGFAQFQQLDPGWLEAGAVWLENLAFGDVFPFATELPSPTQIPNRVTIALACDFGTGDWGSPDNPAASTKIRKAIEGHHPEISIHLGDVYYSGTAGAERANLISIWPAGSIASFALNSLFIRSARPTLQIPKHRLFWECVRPNKRYLRSGESKVPCSRKCLDLVGKPSSCIRRISGSMSTCQMEP